MSWVHTVEIQVGFYLLSHVDYPNEPEYERNRLIGSIAHRQLHPTSLRPELINHIGRSPGSDHQPSHL